MKKLLSKLFLILVFVSASRNSSAQCQSGCIYTPTDPWTFCIMENYNPSDPYSCYDYVRAAVEYNLVDRYCGKPFYQNGGSSHVVFDNIGSSTGQFTGAISSDPKFVFVNNSYNYEVVSYTGHVVLKLNTLQPGGLNYFASKANDIDNLYLQKSPTAVGGGDPTQYLVFVGKPYPLSASLNNGGQQTFTIKLVSGLNYLWSFNTTYFTLIGGSTTSNTITLSAKCPSGGLQQQTVSVSVSSSCSPACGPVRIHNIPVTVNCPIDPCQGTYQVGTSSTKYAINTVNNVSNSPVVATLNGGNGNTFTWSLTSGNPGYWYTYGSGNKTLYLELASGKSASYNVTSTSCNRMITFYRGSYYKLASSDIAGISADFSTIENEAASSIYTNQLNKTLILNDDIQEESVYKIINIQGVVVRSGVIHKSQSEIDIQDLVSGVYILVLPDTKYRFLKQ